MTQPVLLQLCILPFGGTEHGWAWQALHVAQPKNECQEVLQGSPRASCLHVPLAAYWHSNSLAADVPEHN